MRRCCSIVNDIIIGVIPSDPPEPPADLHLFWAVVPLSGGFGENIVAGSFGSSFIPHDGGANLATFLQGTYDDDSGACLNQGDTDYSFWILAETAPTDWTWEGNPISFTDDGVASLKCYTTGVVSMLPDTSAWNLFGITTTMGQGTYQGASPQYNDPAFTLAFLTYCAQVFGLNVSVSFSDLGNRADFKIENVYLAALGNISYDGVTQQNDPYIICP